MKLILIIEDDMAIADLLQDLLHMMGHDVRQAPNGREGLAALEQVQPDLVLCDVMMPLLDGRAVVRQMQADPRHRSIPVVMMSAGRIDLGDLRPAAFLAKPFDVPELLALVERLIGPPAP